MVSNIQNLLYDTRVHKTFLLFLRVLGYFREPVTALQRDWHSFITPGLFILPSVRFGDPLIILEQPNGSSLAPF